MVDQSGEVGSGGEPAGPEAFLAAELGEVLGGQVGASVGGVLSDVAEDVGELQGEAEGVGVLGRSRGAGRARARCVHRAEDAEGEPSDGSGHAAAVGLEVVPGLVGLAADVHQHAVDELVEAAERDGESAGGVCQRDGDRVGVVLVDLSRPDPSEDGAGLLQAGELRLGGQRAVADVVDPPGEGVERGHRMALVGGQQPDSVREIARL